MKQGVLVIGFHRQYLDAPCVIGRAPNAEFKYDDRVLPINVDNVLNRFVITDPTVSRIHAFVKPIVGKDGEISAYSIADLNSMGGTTVIRRGVPKILEPGTWFFLESDDVIMINDVAVTFYVVEREVKRRAVVVGTDPSRRLKGVYVDASEFTATLESLAFKKEAIATLADTPSSTVSRQAILDQLSWLARNSDEDTLSVFFFAGHGSKRGYIVAEDPGDDLNMATLYTAFSKIRGNKLIIFDCCFAGLFKELGKLPNCCFMGAASKDQKAYEHAVKGGVYRRALSKALTAALDQYNTYIHVDELNIVEFKTQSTPGEQNFTVLGNLTIVNPKKRA